MNTPIRGVHNIDVQEFDSSYKRGQPASFGVGGVIKGWTEALQLMRPGDKFELYIPSDLGIVVLCITLLSH